MRDTIYLPSYDLPDGYGAFSGDDEPEEQICPKCLELVEECECQIYDKIEEVELAHERAEESMSRLRPVSMEVMQLSKT